MADLTLKTITKGMEDGAETINDNFDATKAKINTDLADTGWKNITLASGTTATSGQTPQYRVVGTHVSVRGAIDIAASGVAATLPVKPTAEMHFAVAQMSAGVTDRAVIYVEPTGDMKVIVANNYGKHIALDGIEFYTD